MAKELDKVLALKASAKSARDDGEWTHAVADVDLAIQLLCDRAKEFPSMQSKLSSDLADTYGLLGGIEKRWGLEFTGDERIDHLEKSVHAYDVGFGYEQDLAPNDAVTYNRVNRIVGRVLLDSQVLGKDGHVRSGIAEDLREAEEVLDEQINSGRGKDPWAYSDLGTVRLLLGKPDALSAFRVLERLRSPDFVYASTLSTLEPLCDIAADLRPDLKRAIAQLQRAPRYG